MTTFDRVMRSFTGVYFYPDTMYKHVANADYTAYTGTVKSWRWRRGV